MMPRRLVRALITVLSGMISAAVFLAVILLITHIGNVLYSYAWRCFW